MKLLIIQIKKNLDVFVLCDDVESIEYILENNINITAIELHATGLNDYFLLNAVSGFDKQIILGVGGSTIDEINFAVDFLKNKGINNILLMYGFQSYPTKYTDINLSKMLKIRDLFKLKIGICSCCIYRFFMESYARRITYAPNKPDLI